MSGVLSEIESVASDASSVLTAGGPISAAVTAVGNAITQTGKVAETLITNDLQNKSANQKQQSIQTYEELIDKDAAGDPDAPAQLSNFFNELLLRQGIVVGPLSGRFLRVPLEHVTGLVQSNADGTAAIQLLDGIEQTLKGAKLQ